VLKPKKAPGTKHQRDRLIGGKEEQSAFSRSVKIFLPRSRRFRARFSVESVKLYASSDTWSRVRVVPWASWRYLFCKGLYRSESVPARISLRVDGFGVSESFLCSPARLARNGVAGGCECRCARYHTRHRTVARAVELAGCSGARAKGASPERASERSERGAPEKRFTLYRRVCGGAIGGKRFTFTLDLYK